VRSSASSTALSMTARSTEERSTNKSAPRCRRLRAVHRRRARHRPQRDSRRGAEATTCQESEACSARPPTSRQGGALCRRETETVGDAHDSRIAQHGVRAGAPRAEWSERNACDAPSGAQLEHRPRRRLIGEVERILHAHDLADRQRVQQMIAGDVAQTDPCYEPVGSLPPAAQRPGCAGSPRCRCAVGAVLPSRERHPWGRGGRRPY